MIHQQLDACVKRCLGQLNGANIGLADDDARIGLLEQIREGTAIPDNARRFGGHGAIDNAIRPAGLARR